MDTTREDRLCQVCHSFKDGVDEQHFLFSCPAYSDVKQKLASLFQQAFPVSDVLTDSESNACGGFSESVHIGNLLYPLDISFSAFLCVVTLLVSRDTKT